MLVDHFPSIASGCFYKDSTLLELNGCTFQSKTCFFIQHSKDSFVFVFCEFVLLTYSSKFQLGDLGKGAGKGGGGGGSIREAGGEFGKRGAAEEERYFR